MANLEYRRDYILNHLNIKKMVEIPNLSRELLVSEMTIRRDLVRLEEDGLLIRVQGGAVVTQNQTEEPPLNKRLTLQYREKDIIGKKAAEFICDGDVILVDSSSTTIAMIKYIDKKVTVITSNVSIAIELAVKEDIEIILLGGHFRKESFSTGGYQVEETLKNYKADKLFFSSKSVDVDRGVSDATEFEGLVKRAMLDSSVQNFLLIDNTKINTSAFFRVCDIEKVDHIITNKVEYSERQSRFFERLNQKSIDFIFV